MEKTAHAIYATTYSGRRIYFDREVSPDDICITDIAYGLARQPRFNGMLKVFYSVAQHSVMVASESIVHDLGPVYRLQALLHDAPEFILGDMIRPLKDVCPEFRSIEQQIWEAVATKFNIPVEMHPVIKEADTHRLMVEARNGLDHIVGDLRPDWVDWSIPTELLRPLAPGIARQQFMESFYVLNSLVNH